MKDYDINLNYNIVVNTDIDDKSGKIFQETYSEFNDVKTKLTTMVYDIQEKGLQEALIKLGWTPPE